MIQIPLAAGRIVGTTGVADLALGCATARTGAGVYTLTMDQEVDSKACVIQVTPLGATPMAVAIEHTSDKVKTVRINSAGGDPVIASGTNVLVPGNSIPGNAFMLADLVGLLGASDVVSIWLGYPHLNVDVLGAVFLQGYSGDSSGVYAFLDDAAGIPGLFAITLTGNDCRINWAVTKKTLGGGGGGGTDCDFAFNVIQLNGG